MKLFAEGSVDRIRLYSLVVCIVVMMLAGSVYGGDLSEIQKRGVLRHLGIPYANFVTGSGDGLDVDLIRRFADHLGVKYEYVKTSWEEAIGDLTGLQIHPTEGGEIEITGKVPVKGDILANGFTILPWRRKAVDYASPSFPTQVWLIAGFDSALQPIEPSGDIDTDIAVVKKIISGHTVLGLSGTCLDPRLYHLVEAGAKTIQFKGTLNELAPAVINRDAEATLLDVPDSLIALRKWPGKIKVIGPLSHRQNMACAFSKTSPQLRAAFNRFFDECKQNGTYQRLVRKYYPSVFSYYPDFI